MGANRSSEANLPEANPPQGSSPILETGGQWFWQSNRDPWSTTEEPEWTSYSDVENEILEEAFLAKLTSVTLGDYIISFQKGLQFHNQDSNKQRPVKRVVSSRDSQLRQERFFVNAPKPKVSNAAMVFPHPRLVREWLLKHEDMACQLVVDEYGDIITDVGKNLPKLVELATKGIIEEGKKVGELKDAVWIEKKIKDTLKNNPGGLLKCCVNIYTLETFLYKLINNVLRDEDIEKAETLGPFCYLLNIFVQEGCKSFGTAPSAYCHKDIVYRGANLPEEVLKEYSKYDGGKIIAWDGFTSTSKNRSLAEKFGNVLFVIEMGGDMGAGYGTDISRLSYYKGEEEVLMPAGSMFSVERINTEGQKPIVYLKKRDLLGPNLYKHLYKSYLQEKVPPKVVKEEKKQASQANQDGEARQFDTLRIYLQSGFANPTAESTLTSLPPYDFSFPYHTTNQRLYINKIVFVGNSLAYEGEWDMVTQSPAGKGVLILQDGRIFEGLIEEGKPSGRGRTIMTDGSVYEGQYYKGSPTGKGKYTWGKLTPRQGDVYEGEVKDAQGNGLGTLRFANGDVYEGEFFDGQMNGKGTMTYGDGRQYVGEWRNGQKNGKGTFAWPDKRKYVGEFTDNWITGKGIMTYANGKSESGVFEKGTLVAGSK